jgi:hypothetical protein
MVIVNVTENAFSDYKFKLYNEFDYWIESLYSSVDNNNRVSIAVTSKAKSIDLYSHFTTNNTDKNILMITSSGVNLFTNGLFQHIDNVEIKQNVLMGLENYIIDNDIHVLIYSPSIKTGISINKSWFDYTYAMGKNMSVVEREFNQMLFRCRKLNKKQFHIYIAHKASPLKKYKTIEELKTIYLNNGIVCRNDSIITDKDIQITDADISYFNCNEAYLNMRMTNILETYTSNKAFLQEFILRMKYTHNCDVVYEMRKRKNELFENDMFDNAETRRTNTLLNLVNCEFINTEQYEEIKQKLNIQNEHNSVSNEDRLLFKKHSIFKNLNITTGADDEYSSLSSKNQRTFQCDLLKKFTSSDYMERFYTLQKVIYNENFGKKKQDINDVEINLYIDDTAVKKNKDIITKLIYETLPIDTELTNTQFNEFINGEIFQNLTHTLLIPYFQHLDKTDTYKLLYNHTINTNFSSKEAKLIYQCLNHFLHQINYKLRHLSENRNTTRPTDKMIISQLKNSVFTLPIVKTIKPIDTTRNFNQDNLIKSQSNISKNNPKNGGGFIYQEIELIDEYTKTGKLKKAPIKNVISKFEVFETYSGVYKPYKTYYTKSIDKMLKQIELNKKNGVSIDDLRINCIREFKLKLYNPTIVLKKEWIDNVCFIVDDEDDEDVL